jgi:hypothetical protein
MQQGDLAMEGFTYEGKEGMQQRFTQRGFPLWAEGRS